MTFIKKIFKHKLITGIILILIIAGGYFGYQRLAGDKNTVQYVTAAVEKGTLIVSVSGSGQVLALNQLDIKSKVKGEVKAVYVEKGEEVKMGKLIVKLDDADSQKAVRDAETSLETAKLELEKLLSPPDELTLMKAENAAMLAKNSLEELKINQETDYQKALEAIQKAEDDIEKAYEDALNTISNAFLDLPTVMTAIQEILYGYTVDPAKFNIHAYRDYVESEKIIPFISSAESDYKQARTNYDLNLTDYKNTSRYAEKSVVENLLDETTETTKSIAESIRSEKNLIDVIIDYTSEKKLKIPKIISTYQSNLGTYLGTSTSHSSKLLSIKRTLQDSKEAKLNAERDLAKMEKTHPFNLTAAEISLKEKEKSLADLKAGPDELEIRAKKMTVLQKEEALLTAKQDLASCSVYAPFDGIVVETKVKKGDSASAGTVLASIITQQKIAEITLNEIDAAEVKVGQKATLVLDALPELSISGKVIEVDAVGTVTQGVVSYKVKITFDTEEEKVKPGMSVAADIITDVKQNVVLVPNSAVKYQGNAYYIEVMANDNIPRSQAVETGISNDTMTEIVSGLKEGDVVVASTTSSNAVQKTTQTQGFQIPGMTGQQMKGLR